MFSSRAIIRATRAAAPQRVASRVVASSQTRGYATPAADSKPPVALYGLDGTYASALVRLQPVISDWNLSRNQLVVLEVAEVMESS